MVNPQQVELPKYIRPYLSYTVSVPVQITGNLLLVNRATGIVISESTVNLSGIGTYQFLSVGQENAPASYLFTDSYFSLNDSSFQNLDTKSINPFLVFLPDTDNKHFDLANPLLNYKLNF